MFRLTSLNLNGIRSATTKGLEPWLAAHAPDCMCVQEVKAQQADIVGKFEVLAEMRHRLPTFQLEAWLPWGP